MAIWDNPRATARRIHEKLSQHHPWQRKTINTFLSRLADKGVVKVERGENTSFYRATVSRNACVENERQSFLQRVFRGAVAPMILHFCESSNLSPDELKQLEKQIREMRKEKSRETS